MRRVDYVHCLECDAEIECDVLRDEYGEFLDSPENCPDCGADLDEQLCVGVDQREDFHSDV
jgi:hypothetical protein